MKDLTRFQQQVHVRRMQEINERWMQEINEIVFKTRVQIGDANVCTAQAELGYGNTPAVRAVNVANISAILLSCYDAE